MSGPWRDPDAETTDYPGLWVHDGRVSGSITLGQSRLPMWVAAPLTVGYGWDEFEAGYRYDDEPPGTVNGMDRQSLAAFVGNLVEVRGEFARLLCVLADEERKERGPFAPAWWEKKRGHKRVREALQRCLDAIGDTPSELVPWGRGETEGAQP